MSALTMADVAEYFTAYAAQYGTPLTLSIDAIEEVLSGTTDDDINVILPALHEVMQLEADTAPDMTGLPVEVDQSMGSPYSYAIQFDATFFKDIDVLAEAAIENKRGGAVIMLDLYRIFTEEVVTTVWPAPGSEKGKVGDNEAWDREETTVTKIDGTTGKGTRSFYSDLVALSARGAELLAEKAKLKEKQGDVLHYKPKMAAIDGKVNNFKSSIVRAVQLAQKMAFVNAKTGMSASIVMDSDDDAVPAKSNKLVFIRNTLDASKFDVITIGQFLALKVSEGATYSAIVGTSQRKKNAGTGPVVQNTKVETIAQFDEVTAAYASFFEKLMSDTKATNGVMTHLNGANSDDLILSLNTIMLGIDGYLSKPGIAKRLSDLQANGKTVTKAVA